MAQLEKFEKPGNGVSSFEHVIPRRGSVASDELAHAMPGNDTALHTYPAEAPARRPKVSWENLGAEGTSLQSGLWRSRP